MKKLNLFLILVIIIGTMGGIAAFSLKARTLLTASRVMPPTLVPPTLPPQSTPTPLPSESGKTNFSVVGNLAAAEGKAGQGSEQWSLVYEAPGEPALKVKLVFKPASLCNGQSCSGFKLKAGDRVRVEGTKAGTEVTVNRLTRVSS